MYIHKLALIVVFLGTIRCDKKIKKFKNREVFLSAEKFGRYVFQMYFLALLGVIKR